MDEVIQMKAALLSLALLGGQSVLLVSDRVPQFNVEASCMETIAENERFGLVGITTPSDRMQEKKAAQQKLSSVWTTTAGSIRDRCEEQVNKSDAHSSLIFSSVFGRQVRRHHHLHQRAQARGRNRSRSNISALPSTRLQVRQPHCQFSPC